MLTRAFVDSSGRVFNRAGLELSSSRMNVSTIVSTMRREGYPLASAALKRMIWASNSHPFAGALPAAQSRARASTDFLADPGCASQISFRAARGCGPSTGELR
jgi:hypothetical protein